MGVLLTDQIEQIPGSVREDHAMHLSSVLNGEEQTVECFLRTGSSNGSKCAFSFLCIFVVNGFTNGFATLGALGDSSGCDHMKNLLFAPALFLNAISISVENFEDGQRLQFLGKLARHVQRRRQCHHCVKADIIFPAEGAGVCECPGCHKPAQVGAGSQLIGERGNEFVGRRLLHETHKRFKRAEVE